MKGLDFDWILAKSGDAEGSRENNITGSWKGYQNLSGSSTCPWTPTVGTGSALPPEHPSVSPCAHPTHGQERHLTVVPRAMTFVGPYSPWDAPSLLATFPPTLPDLLGVEQTSSVGRGLAALWADESATWAWLPLNTVPSLCTLGKKIPSFPNTSLSCYPRSFDCPLWPTIGTSSAPPYTDCSHPLPP